MANPIYAAKRASDFIRDFDMAAYVFDSHYVLNTTASEVTLKGPMYPVKAGAGGAVEVMTTAEAAVPANIVGFLVVGSWETLAATTGVSQMPYAVLKNGPSVVSKEGYATTDLAGGTYDPADFDTFAAAASPFIKTADSTGALTSAPFKL